MSHNKKAKRKKRTEKKERRKNEKIFYELILELIPDDQLFTQDRFHGNIKWTADDLVRQALIWSWQETKKVTDAFEQALEICEALGFQKIAHTYTAFMNALDRYRETFNRRLWQQFHLLAETMAGRFWRDEGWLLMGFDGSRASTPRTVANEKEFCAPNYGQGATAKYRKKKTKGMRRKKNEKNKPQPQGPQVWITMMWHMSLRLPWSWRLGPSNSSERGHVVEMLEQEEFPKNTLFCGDAGFVGYPLWDAILKAEGDFLVRVGGNVSLLSEVADVKQLGDGHVLCWPREQMNSGGKPLRLRLVNVTIGKTQMWMLTSVLDSQRLTTTKIVQYYKMRWGVEVEFRGLKQTIDKANLRCRNGNRVYVELDWSIHAMAFAELLALGEQIAAEEAKADSGEGSSYDTKDRSLANTVRAIRRCMRNLHKYAAPQEDLRSQLSRALVQKYKNRTDKKARYRRKNPDKKPLGEPTVRKLNREERKKLAKINAQTAA